MDGAAVWATLSEDCRSVGALRAELRVSGRLSGRGFPSLTTAVGVEAHRLSLVAMAGARSVFHLAGDRRDVVLLNHLDATTTRGAAADVVEALVGVRLEPDRLLAILSGCASPDPSPTGADRVGTYGRVRTGDTTIYLRARDGAWQLAAAEFADVVVDYRRVDGRVPREIEVRRGPDVTLRLRVIEFERNPQLPDAVFTLRVPASFADVSIDDLRRNGPLGGSP